MMLTAITFDVTCSIFTHFPTTHYAMLNLHWRASIVSKLIMSLKAEGAKH